LQTTISTLKELETTNSRLKRQLFENENMCERKMFVVQGESRLLKSCIASSQKAVVRLTEEVDKLMDSCRGKSEAIAIEREAKLREGLQSEIEKRDSNEHFKNQFDSQARAASEPVQRARDNLMNDLLIERQIKTFLEIEIQTSNAGLLACQGETKLLRDSDTCEHRDDAAEQIEKM
jgi:hypothetical protein